MSQESTPKTILVVDDSAVDRALLKGLLRKHWPTTQVLEAGSGQEALEFAKQRQLDLVLTDLCMPNSSGLDLVNALRESQCHSPVVVMTGFGNEQTAVEALQAGAASYIAKGKLRQLLVSTVETVLESAQSHHNRRRISSSVTSIALDLKLENDATLVSPLIRFLQDQIGSMRLLDEQQLVRIGVALHEALSNAIHHGNLELSSDLRQDDETIYYELAATRRVQWPYCDRRVHVHASLNTDRMQFVIRDEGPGFAYQQVNDATEDENLQRVGGRGLLLIRSFMDEVYHNLKGNEITLEKYTTPAKAFLARSENPVPRRHAPHSQTVAASEVALACPD